MGSCCFVCSFLSVFSCWWVVVVYTESRLRSCQTLRVTLGLPERLSKSCKLRVGSGPPSSTPEVPNTEHIGLQLRTARRGLRHREQITDLYCSPEEKKRLAPQHTPPVPGLAIKSAWCGLAGGSQLEVEQLATVKCPLLLYVEKPASQAARARPAVHTYRRLLPT